MQLGQLSWLKGCSMPSSFVLSKKTWEFFQSSCRSGTVWALVCWWWVTAFAWHVFAVVGFSCIFSLFILCFLNRIWLDLPFFLFPLISALLVLFPHAAGGKWIISWLGAWLPAEVSPPQLCDGKSTPCFCPPFRALKSLYKQCSVNAHNLFIVCYLAAVLHSPLAEELKCLKAWSSS